MFKKFVIAEKGSLTLLLPFNTYDTNYHVLDWENDKHYRIDVGDVGNPEVSLLSFDQLKELDIDVIEECSWKTTEIDY